MVVRSFSSIKRMCGSIHIIVIYAICMFGDCQERTRLDLDSANCDLNLMLTFISNEPKSKTKNHLSAIKRELAYAETISICSGHLKAAGIELISGELKAAVARGARIIFYSNGEDTEPSAVTALAELRIEHIVVRHFYLHTKLYYFEMGERYSAYLGSANITAAGLKKNEEFSVAIAGSKGDEQHLAISNYLSHLDRRCRTVLA